MTDFYGSSTSRSFIGPNANAGVDEFQVLPGVDLKRIVEIVRNDSTAWAGITTLVDRTLENGWYLEAISTGSPALDYEKTLRNKRFNTVLRESLFHLFTYQNAFIELVYTGADTPSVKEIHILDPTTIKIIADEHGEVQRYEQTAMGQTVTWQPDEIVHIRTSSIDTNVWGEIDLKTIYTACSIKYHVKRYINWIFEKNQMKGFFNIESAGETSIKEFLSYMKEQENDLSKPVVAEGKVVYQMLRNFDEGEKLLKVMYKMDEEILNLLQVPPIFAGLPDNSNRSNAEAQERAFNTRINSIQDLYEDVLTYDFLPKLRMFDTRFSFKPISKKHEKDALEVASQLKNMGVKGEIIGKYLRDNGFDFPDGDIFEPPMLPDVAGQPGMPGKVKMPGDSQYPSRKHKAEGESSKKMGTGTEGTTREEQLVGKTEGAGKFNKYPYVIEVV